MMEQKKSRISKLKVGIATVAVAALLVVPAGASEHEETTSLDFELQGGGFTMGLANGSMEDITEYGLDMSTTGSADITVEDLRGEGGEWNIVLEADDFVGADNADTIPASGLNADLSGTVDDTNGTEGAVTPTACDSGLATPCTHVSTTSGADGAYAWSLGLELDVPDGTLADNYSSTLTMTSSAQPDA